SMFEPMGGSAPKYTGTGKINPIATINAVSMLLDRAGHTAAAERVMNAIMHVTANKMKSQNAGKMGYNTSEVGDLVVDALA
ncbi:MAG TPA: 3-isopropylmalate dehydrogenase, partial [Planctomycetaceae bacterium]|nr:3-isopropylmalate dehydrogenase [Planctomycetaceae bacterium]